MKSCLTCCICCRKLVEEFGLWDQIRVDYGTEWALILHVQNLLSEHRNDPTLAPYVQTSSRQVNYD